MLITVDQQTEMPHIFDPPPPLKVNINRIAIIYHKIVVRSAGLEPARVLPHSDLNE